MKINLYICCLLISSWVMGQLKVVPLELSRANQRYVSNDTVYTLTLPFWDDFSTSSIAPDTMLWTYGPDVYINATLPKNAPTYRAATFDGLNQSGSAHNIDAEFNGATDSLVSHYIDLSQVVDNKRNTVYLSFYWQAEGNGEIPDDSDSLRVQYFTEDSTWITQWVQLGGIQNVSDKFEQVILPVEDQRFFHEKFRIKFQAFASLQGQFDTWHVDYIYLNQNRSAADTSHFDRALSGSTSPLFGLYYEMPATHFFSNPKKYLSKQSISTVNLDAVTEAGHPLEYYYLLENLTTHEVYNLTNMGNAGEGRLTPLEYRSISGPDTSAISVVTNDLDSQVIASTFYYETGDKFLFEEIVGDDSLFLPVNLKVNDTIRQTYTLNDHYAYDDGTAEFALAMNVIQGEVAMRYFIEEIDTLTHVDIYFPNSAPDPSGASVDVKIWRDLEEETVISRTGHTVTSPSAVNAFTRIKLTNPVIVKDTIYVGFQQFVDRYLPIGFDRNNAAASSEIFSKATDTWEQNTLFSGSLMIRPVFGRDTAFTLSTRKIIKQQFTLYPNPSRGKLQITPTHDAIQIFSLSGQLLYESRQREVHEVSFLEDGIYLLKVFNRNQTSTQKLIIRQ